MTKIYHPSGSTHALQASSAQEFQKILETPLNPLQPKTFPIGIVGGGQLAWMLGLACQDLGVPCSVYAQTQEDSAALSGIPTFFGPLNDSEKLQHWMKHHETILIESELTPYAPLQKALQGASRELTPSLQALGIARDKLQQKILFHQLGLMTAPWTEFEITDDPQSILRQLREVQKQFGQGLVLKWALEGYDGRGVLVLNSHELHALTHSAGESTLSSFQKVVAFFQTAFAKKVPLYGESLIPFEREVAITMTRRRSQNTPQNQVFYPLVISEQHQGTCYRVKSIALEPGLSTSNLESQAREAARLVGHYLGIVGTFALEFFVTADGTLLINEMAPRVHNSSHCSQVARDASQFHNHIRAALDLPLLNPSYPPFYGMTNLLGPEGFEGPISLPEIPFHHHRELYWYDKNTTKTRRKLGHINSWASSAEEFKDYQVEIERFLNSWKSRYRATLSPVPTTSPTPSP